MTKKQSNARRWYLANRERLLKKAAERRKTLNQDAMNAYNREWHHAHPGKRAIYRKRVGRARMSAHKRAYYRRHVERLKQLSSLRRAGISAADFAVLLALQDGKCAICWRIPKERLAVDHCHVGSHIRGLLCHQCNLGLGNFRDNAELLHRAIAYLSKPVDHAVFAFENSSSKSS